MSVQIYMDYHQQQQENKLAFECCLVQGGQWWEEFELQASRLQKVVFVLSCPVAKVYIKKAGEGAAPPPQ